MKNIRGKHGTLTVSGIVLACTMLAPASHACISTQGGGAFANRTFLSMGSSVDRLTAPGYQRDQNNRERQDPTIVGMWIVTFYVGTYTGPNTQVYDRAIQQFFADGNELMNSASFPPTVGNVCFGVWKEVGRRAFRLRHIGWTFTTAGTFEGTARIDATLTVGQNGDVYSGTFTADIIDANGNVLPGSEAKGDVRAVRFQVTQ